MLLFLVVLKIFDVCTVTMSSMPSSPKESISPWSRVATSQTVFLTWQIGSDPATIFEVLRSLRSGEARAALAAVVLTPLPLLKCQNAARVLYNF